MFLGRANNPFLFAFLAFALSACGGSFESPVDLNEKMVPVDSGSASFDSHEPGGEMFVEADESPVVSSQGTMPQGPDNTNPTQMMSLRDKVLMASGVPQRALDKAFAFYNKKQSFIRNKKYMSIFDIGQHSGQRRLFLIDLNSGAVQSMHVAHGNGSDANHDGVANGFSNTNGSNMSSLGFMLTAETYFGKHGESFKLDGLESRNSNVRDRAIVVHGASYVDPGLSKMGRSQGCPAVSKGNIKSFMAKTKNGSLYYIYHASYE